MSDAVMRKQFFRINAPDKPVPVDALSTLLPANIPQSVPDGTLPLEVGHCCTNAAEMLYVRNIVGVSRLCG